jgi:hypothetical protein
MTIKDSLLLEIVPLRHWVIETLEARPELKSAVYEIAISWNTDAGYRLDDTPEERERKEIARLERVLANLKDQERVLLAS